MVEYSQDGFNSPRGIQVISTAAIWGPTAMRAVGRDFENLGSDIPKPGLSCSGLAVKTAWDAPYRISSTSGGLCTGIGSRIQGGS